MRGPVGIRLKGATISGPVGTSAAVDAGRQLTGQASFPLPLADAGGGHGAADAAVAAVPGTGLAVIQAEIVRSPPEAFLKGPWQAGVAGKFDGRSREPSGVSPFTRGCRARSRRGRRGCRRKRRPWFVCRPGTGGVRWPQEKERWEIISAGVKESRANSVLGVKAATSAGTKRAAINGVDAGFGSGGRLHRTCPDLSQRKSP